MTNAYAMIERCARHQPNDGLTAGSVLAGESLTAITPTSGTCAARDTGDGTTLPVGDRGLVEARSLDPAAPVTGAPLEEG